MEAQLVVDAGVPGGRERGAEQKLHGDEGVLVGYVDLVRAHHVGVPKADQQLSFVHEHAQDGRVAAQVLADDLECHRERLARGLGRTPQVDGRHAATGNLGHDLVAP